jgi:hypothetical protein
MRRATLNTALITGALMAQLASQSLADPIPTLIFHLDPPDAAIVYQETNANHNQDSSFRSGQPHPLTEKAQGGSYTFRFSHPDYQESKTVFQSDDVDPRKAKDGVIHWPSDQSVHALEPKTLGARMAQIWRLHPTLIVLPALLITALAAIAALTQAKKRAGQKLANRITQLGGDPNKPRMGDYIQLNRLGAGGFGEVIKGVHLQELFTPKPTFVAIKTILPHLVQGTPIPVDPNQPGTKYPTLPPETSSDNSFFKRFQREAKLLENLNHPSIVRLHSYDFVADPPHIVMDFVEGESLDKLIDRNPQGISPEQALKIMTPIMAAIAHCHGHKPEIVHRDLKPQNIMLRPDGTPLVMDFGIANRDGEERITQTGGFVGSSSYAAPEGIAGQKGPSLDQYALGAILYELLTGTLANSADGNAMAELRNAMAGRVKWLKDARPQWTEFAEAVDKMRAQEPKDRYPSVQAALQALSRITLPKG